MYKNGMCDSGNLQCLAWHLVRNNGWLFRFGRQWILVVEVLNCPLMWSWSSNICFLSIV